LTQQKASHASANGTAGREDVLRNNPAERLSGQLDVDDCSHSQDEPCTGS
jgi:hypothetical protein